MENKYEFRKFLNRVHKPGRRDYSVKAGAGETEVKDGWKIIIGKNAPEVVEKAAKDLQDYFFTSMGVSVLLMRGNPGDAAAGNAGAVLIGTEEDFGAPEKDLKAKMSFRLSVEGERITVCGFDARGCAQGCYYMEDLMNIREAPVLATGSEKREPVFSPRMTHSGWGLDYFPDAHLSSIAHAGMDAILVFVKGVDMTAAGYTDLRDLAARAASFGLDVYLYSYIKSIKHPEEQDALEYYRAAYGRLFKECPGAKGVVLVGESCEFPSKDTVNTTGRLRGESRAQDFSRKPSPGWWPCFDYPLWLEMIKKTVREHSPGAEIVFWTYNWGYAPEKDRISLVESLPPDITLLVTFEMFEQVEKDGVYFKVPDYTISFEGPGKYFLSEAKAAAKRNIRLYTMSNTAGLTWDFGVVPYIPVPFQWQRRHSALHEAAEKYGLSGLMESHHYGFYPSVISELSKWSFWLPRAGFGATVGKLARRDFGEKAAPHVLKCWESWSKAMKECYIAVVEDQNGPFRVGPSYPFIFHPQMPWAPEPREIPMPSSPHAYRGSGIVTTFYHPYEVGSQPPGAMRIPVEIKLLKKMLALWRGGLASMEKAAGLTPRGKKENSNKMLFLGRFIENSVITALNVKQWYVLNVRLLGEKNKARALVLLERMERIALEEIRNAENTMFIVKSDSRLGWEPSMDYMTDAEHLEWKIRQVKSVIDWDIAQYRRTLEL